MRRAALLLIGLLGAVCLLGTLLTRNYSVLGEFSPEVYNATLWANFM